MPAPIISFREAAKIFPGRKGAEVRAVDGVTLDIRAGEIFGVIGYSGAGKSTLVRLVNALERTTGGAVVVDGTDLTGLSEARLRPVRAGIGMIFQQFNLLSSRTVAGNVAYPLEVAGWPRARRRERVRELLDFVGIADKADVYPAKLSGGQKQRVGIARALATNPKILLADEATSALDPETTHDVLALLQRVNRELGITVVVITHEMDVVRSVCDRVAVMEHGKVVELGDAYQVFSAPRQDVTRRFVSTALKDRPSPAVIARLRARHTGRIVTVGVDDVSGSSAHVTHVLREHGVDGTIVYGGITEVAERPYGSLTLEIVADGAAGDDPRVEAAVAGLRAVTDVVDHGTARDPLDDAAPSGGPTGLLEGNDL
ncbi:ATP-binding cassette domain-containing protein [Isoptericola sp. NEAU-Y5]|uniref:ATP-binding cassette domain-containing protein n=1 Tax=Isoptericola luteus TaxID=2879484 RepID=A0ABS7ZH42_9MICO|nr:ATP-binding cassette domain-containing protein [Isoptericola sp. NEAU-Y5]MCA5894340.1 ATP-binding cassette domain-containing protein [Isoptericola sp. NEAU-Y5]